jgi:hypothetical protein
VSRGATWLQDPRGENHRPQDGAAGLVDRPEPTDPGAVSQGDLFGGIDLPGLVRRGGPARDGAGTPGGRSRPEAGVAEPAAKRTRAGPGGLGSSLAQSDPDQDRPPGGVLASQSQSRLADLRREGMGELPGGVIVGRDAVGPAIAESLAEVSHGAGSQAESGGEAGGRLALLGTLE